MLNFILIHLFSNINIFENNDANKFSYNDNNNNLIKFMVNPIIIIIIIII